MEQIEKLEILEGLKTELKEAHPEDWDKIPDIDLYMDQVINYMPRQHVGFEFDEALTSAMINNYIKVNLLPRAKGKKYNREHIAYLTAICLLKQVLSVGDTGTILTESMKSTDIKKFYEEYICVVGEKFNEVADEIEITPDKEKLLQQAMRLAVSSYAQKLACESILKTIAASDENTKGKK